MISGKLNRRIQIQQQTSSQDAFGQEQQSWSAVYSCWASIDVQQSQLLYSTAEFVSKVTHRFSLRWTSSVVITDAMRVIYAEPTTGVTHVYEIQAVLNDKQANRELVLLAYELNSEE